MTFKIAYRIEKVSVDPTEISRILFIVFLSIEKHLSTYLFHYLDEYFAFSLRKLFSSLRGALLKILKDMQKGKLI